LLEFVNLVAQRLERGEIGLKTKFVVGLVAGVGALEFCGQRPGDPRHGGRIVPEMGIIARFPVHQFSRHDRSPIGRFGGLEQGFDPGVVVGAVVDHQAGIGDEPRRRRAGFEFMGVLVGIGQDAVDAGFGPGDLASHVAIEIFRGDDLGGRLAASRNNRKSREGDGRQDDGNDLHRKCLLCLIGWPAPSPATFAI
jgi:hypothetical protein